MSSIFLTNSRHGGSGGSVWIIGENISGSGYINAEGMTTVGATGSYGGYGGRIRFDSDEYSYKGIVSCGGGQGDYEFSYRYNYSDAGTFSWGRKNGTTNYT